MGAAVLVPGVQFRFISVDDALFFELAAMNRQVSGFLPTLNGSDFAPKVSGDFLPGVETTFRRRLAGPRGRSGCLVTHGGNCVLSGRDSNLDGRVRLEGRKVQTQCVELSGGPAGEKRRHHRQYRYL